MTIELMPVAPHDDFVMELLWNAQMGNTEYPFVSQATLAKEVPTSKIMAGSRHSWYESR